MYCPQAGLALTFFLQQKKVSKTRPYRTVRSGGNAAADEKIAKNQAIPLKENNSLRSNRFSFLTLHTAIFFTHFIKGGKLSNNNITMIKI